MVFWVNRAFWRNCRQILCKTSFSHLRRFQCCRISSFRWGSALVWHLWIGRARHPGPSNASFVVVVFNIGGWLTHGDLVLDTEFDFLAVVEHRLIPARVRSEWVRLRRKGLATVRVPASQETSHVGHAGVVVKSQGVLQFLCQPLLLRSGRAVRCMLPLGRGRFLHLVVLYGYQGADRQAEKLALPDQLDAALGELGRVPREQPCLVVGDFNVEPTQDPLPGKRDLGWFGLTLKLLGPVLLGPGETS